MSLWLRYVIVAVAAYLLGSFSTGLIVARATNHADLRTVGSRNTGASNALRTMGVRDGLITFFGDFIKAALACGLGWLLIGLYGAMAAGLAVIIGHNWPVFFDFRGGKGVASSCAVMLVCFPVPALIAYAAGAVTIALTKYISLGSLVVLTVFAGIVIALHTHNTIIIIWSVLLALMCYIRHRANIARLIHGTEAKIGQKA